MDTCDKEHGKISYEGKVCPCCELLTICNNLTEEKFKLLEEVGKVWDIIRHYKKYIF